MRDVVLTVIIVAMLPVCLLRPWIGVLMWNWVGLMNPHRLTWGFAESLPFAYMVALCTLVGLSITRDRKPVAWSSELVLVMFLLAHFALTSIFAWAPEPAWERWVDFGKVVLMTVVATMLIFGRERVRWLFTIVALSVAFYGVKGGLWVFLTGGGERVQGPAGSFLSGNTFIGLGLCMVLPLVAVLVREETRLWLRRCYKVTVFLVVVAILFTYSRGALLGLCVVLWLMIFKTKRPVATMLIVVPLGIAVAIWAPDQLFKRAESIGTYEQDYSAMQRIQSWTVAFNVAKDSPIVGAGFSFESYPDSRRWMSYSTPELLPYGGIRNVAHSIYFQIMGQHGFVGLGLFLSMLFVMLASLRNLERQTRNDPELEWIARYAGAIKIGIVGYMIAGAFLSSGYFDLVYVYVSLTAILRRELRTARSGAVSASYGSGKDTPKFPAPVPSAAGNRGGVLAPLPAGGRPFAEGDPSARPRGRTEPALRIGRTDDPGSRPDRTGFSGKLPDGS